jgi:putative phosphoribosyl transferase
VERLQFEADEVVCLQTPLFFNAVGEWYVEFAQTQDDEVCSLLAEAGKVWGSRKSDRRS